MRVRVNSVYTYHPVLMDMLDHRIMAMPGDRVRVVNLYGAPKANTMGHCYIESMDREFLGLVNTNSLVKE